MQSKLKKTFSAYAILFFDWLKYEMQWNNEKYLQIHNRMERIEPGPNGLGYVCLWPYTSRLKAVETWKFLGQRLLRRMLHTHSFSPKQYRLTVDDPKTSIIIGHRGMERLPLLLTTLKSIASQKEIDLECIVVEQDEISRIEKYLPSWVRYIFQKNPVDGNSYNRSATFNCGAMYAKGEVLILHDNDMLIPDMYCHDINEIVKRGYEAINIKRYVFYLDQIDSEKVVKSFDHLEECYPSYVVQNLEAGGSLGITKKAYMLLGGMDENFIGWGGEDNEFWGRCSEVKKWIWGFSPIIHLWHKSQPLKEDSDNSNIERARTLENISAKERIRRLQMVNKNIYIEMER